MNMPRIEHLTCPACGARPGYPCRGFLNTVLAEPHIDRREAHARIWPHLHTCGFRGCGYMASHVLSDSSRKKVAVLCYRHAEQFAVDPSLISRRY